MQKTVFITGCSSGIGAAMAKEFHQRGCFVYATARKIDALAPLAEQDIRTLELDVNDDQSIANAFAAVTQERGQIDVLINNAGFSQVGALIDLDRDAFRKQYETNVIAPMLVTRAAVPLLRTSFKQDGKNPIVANVGSIVGITATPFAGAYCSSKAAIHSLSDTLRMELAPLGIDVVMIQPGGVQSSFGNHAEAAICLPTDSYYRSVEDGIRARAQAGQQQATPAEEFVRPIVVSLLSGNSSTVLRGGKNSFRLPLLKKLLPTKVLDAKLSAIYGLNRLTSRR